MSRLLLEVPKFRDLINWLWSLQEHDLIDTDCLAINTLAPGQPSHEGVRLTLDAADKGELCKKVEAMNDLLFVIDRPDSEESGISICSFESALKALRTLSADGGRVVRADRGGKPFLTNRQLAKALKGYQLPKKLRAELYAVLAELEDEEEEE